MKKIWKFFDLKVSVITVCYNSESTIEKCLQSVISQDYNNIEHIIVDGNSDNRVKDYLNRKFPNIKLKLIKQNRGKFVRACLIGIENLDTNFFTFMHDDDYISPFFIEMINFAIENNTSVIGNGIVLPKESSHFKFKNLNNFEKIKSNVLINKYYCSKKINQIYLPANPACSIFKTEILLKLKITHLK